jgi:hypothetical protein
MALQFASDNEKTILERINKSQGGVHDIMKKSWAIATRENLLHAYFQLQEDDVRYMFHLSNEKTGIKATLIASQELFKK